MVDFDLGSLSKNLPDDDRYYIGTNGLKRCKKCDCAVEMILSSRYREDIKVGCMCKCELEEKENEAIRNKVYQVEINRKHCFGASKLINVRFEHDNVVDAKCWNYANEYGSYLASGIGLLLHGKVGAGKSYLAACIANELIDQGYLVKYSTLTTMVNEMNATFEDKADYLYKLNRYDLIIIDDFGTERNTEFMNEQAYSVINARYESGKPMVITTNLSGEELNHPPTIDTARLFDRILEVCHPVEVKGTSRRRKSARDKYNEIESMLRGDADAKQRED